MSTNPQTTTEPNTNARTIEPSTDAQTTEIAARNGTDPWAAPDEAVARPSARTQRQFEPTSRSRMKNLMDDENAYCDG